MGYTLTEKIIYSHIKGKTLPKKNEEFYLDIDYTLTQDATGTLAYLEFMSMGLETVRTKLSLSFVDHNTLQTGFENADDHLFLETFADKYGVLFSKAGNGICHQVMLERFTKPGITLLGSDSHTPTSGALGALSIGAGGLDVAVALSGKPFKMKMPEIVNVKLTGKLKKYVSAKDIVLEVIKRVGTKGGLNKIFEYSGSGASALSVFERATICNMGAEMGLTSSIFESDIKTLEFLSLEKRSEDYIELKADEDAVYDSLITINLDEVEPLVACPYSPGNVKPLKELIGLKVDQVLIGSCTNSSYKDMATVASILKNKKVSSDVSFGINPGSRQVLKMMSDSGVLSTLISAGARILESSCGPCIGMGQAPRTDSVSFRTYNRNFLGRSSTLSAKVYIVSPIIASIVALYGEVVDLDKIDINLDEFTTPLVFDIDDSMILKPTFKKDVIMGPNITPIPKFGKLEKKLNLPIILKLKDDVSTDDIMPAGAKILPFRSNIEKLSDFSFYNIFKGFKAKALENKNSVILAGLNYGQGSSREHASIVPRYLGIRAVLALSFSRIHRQNLINFGIVPIEISANLYESLNEDELINLDFSNLDENIIYINDNEVLTSFTQNEIDILKEGGLLNTI